MTRLALLLMWAWCCGVAHAQLARCEGEFLSRQLALRVVLLDPDEGVAAAGVSIAEGACSGSVAGIGVVRNRRLAFSPYVKVPGSESCLVTVEWDAQWRTAKVADNGLCTPYYGASCSLTGQRGVRK